jgi:hypothetical protein
MILLYIILLNYDKVPGEELLQDVEKSHEILLAMEEASVARRSAALMFEVIEVTKAYLIRRRRLNESMSGNPQNDYLGMVRTGGASDGVNDMSLDQRDNWQQTLFAEDFLGLRRVDMLSTLIDPNILEGFAGQNAYSVQNDFFLDLDSHVDPGVWGQGSRSDLM